MAGPLARFAYVSDDGTTYSVRGDVSNNVAIGNLPNSTAPDKPQSMHCRYVNAHDASDGSSRQLIVGDPTNPIWLGPGASNVTIADFDNDPNTQTVHTVRSRIGERRYAR